MKTDKKRAVKLPRFFVSTRLLVPSLCMALFLGAGCGVKFNLNPDDFLTPVTSTLPSISWTSVGATQWTNFNTHLTAVKTAGTTAAPSFSTVTILSGAHQGDGFVLAPNGYMYSVPYGGGLDVLKFDPIAGTTSRFGNLGGAWYPGAVLGLNGKIYAFPERNSSNMIEIDPATDTIRTIVTPVVTTPCGGNAKWSGAAVAPNGKIYGIPACADHIVEYDPNTDIASLVGSDYTGCFYCWTRASLAPNGKIYGMPNMQTLGQPVSLDPNTNTSTLLPGVGAVSRTCGTALTLNGLMFGFPCGGATLEVRAIDSNTDTFNLAYSFGAAPAIWSGVPGPNGKIYAHNGMVAGQLVEFDPDTLTVTTYPGVIPAGADSEGGQIGPDGKMYWAPYNGDKIFVIDMHLARTPDINVILSPYFNGAH